MKALNCKLTTSKGKVSGLWLCPRGYRAALVLAHGAGAGMTHPFMNSIAEQLADHKVATMRFQFPYWEAKTRRPDRPEVAIETIWAAVQWAQKKVRKKPLFLGGKSFGGRMGSLALAGADAEQKKVVRGICYLGFPLHPPKKQSTDRAKHLGQISCSQLFLQGTRDSLAEISLIRSVTRPIRKAKLHIIDGADHGFSVLKRSGRTNEQVLEEMAQTISDWIAN